MQKSAGLDLALIPEGRIHDALPQRGKAVIAETTIRRIIDPVGMQHEERADQILDQRTKRRLGMAMYETRQQ